LGSRRFHLALIGTLLENPGDAGQAPQINWVMPAGFHAGELFGLTYRLKSVTLLFFGYSDELKLLCNILHKKMVTGSNLHIKANISWVACSDIVFLERHL